jgi:hypothetical protein
MGVIVLAVLAFCTTPAAAAVIEFTLGSEPEVELLAFSLMPGVNAITVTALLGSSSASWVQDATTGQDFSEAVLTVTAPPTVSTTTFSDVVAASAMVNMNIGSETITATFDFESSRLQVSSVPEPSTWAMMLLGFAGLGFAFKQSRRKVAFA